jgi:hypothetical protein
LLEQIHEDTECKFCKEPRHHSRKPHQKFVYIPLIPRLKALLHNCDLAKKMQNCHKRDLQNMEEERSGRAGESMQDVFNSAHYHSLKDRHIKIHNTTLNSKYFSGKCNIALGLCTDGVGPFKTRKVSCWPLVVVNYNLPPDLMFLLDYIMSLGVIPGPNEPKDSDSFLWPLMEEMLQFAKEVHAFDVLDSEYFLLRAFLIQVFSDISAVSMLLWMTGHNRFCPCRLCSITGIRIPGQSKPYYVPHN